MARFTNVLLHGCEQDFDAIVIMMDDGFRDHLHSKLCAEAPTDADAQNFLSAHLFAQEAKFGEAFDLN